MPKPIHGKSPATRLPALRMSPGRPSSSPAGMRPAASPVPRCWPWLLLTHPTSEKGQLNCMDFLGRMGCHNGPSMFQDGSTACLSLPNGPGVSSEKSHIWPIFGPLFGPNFESTGEVPHMWTARNSLVPPCVLPPRVPRPLHGHRNQPGAFILGAGRCLLTAARCASLHQRP